MTCLHRPSAILRKPLTRYVGWPSIIAMNASEIIDKLGGTVAVARICDVKSPSVSEWRHRGIPRAQLKYLQLLRPDIFGIKRKKKAA